MTAIGDGMNGSGPKILFVDDDPKVLAAYKRTFRKDYPVSTAEGPVEGLGAVAEEGPFAVVVSDLRMPGMDGIEFFTQLKNRCPDTVRIMLTGFADLGAAISAVNQGHVFRFLAKPCAEGEMREALAAGVRQYRLITAEREFIRGTLKGVIKVLTDLLAMANATAHQRCARIKRLATDLGRASGMNEPWRMELAVMLSQLGFLILPERLLERRLRGLPLDVEQETLFSLHPKLGGDLLANIPRMEEIAQTIAYQEKRFDGSGPPEGGSAGKAIPLGGRILKAALDFDALQQQGCTRGQALQAMRKLKGHYDPELLDLMEPLLSTREGYTPAVLPPDDLAAGMVLESNLGETVPRGRPLSDTEARTARETALRQGLQELQAYVPLKEPSILDEIDPGLMSRIQNQKRLLGAEHAPTESTAPTAEPRGGTA